MTSDFKPYAIKQLDMPKHSNQPSEYSVFRTYFEDDDIEYYFTGKDLKDCIRRQHEKAASHADYEWTYKYREAIKVLENNMTQPGNVVYHKLCDILFKPKSSIIEEEMEKEVKSIPNLEEGSKAISLPLHNLEDVRNAINSDNVNQQLIANMGLRVITLLLEKNRSYGSSAFKPPMLARSFGSDGGIKVRLSDKLERIINILEDPKQAETKLFSEPLPQTVMDAAGYMILWLIDLERKTDESSK